MRTLRTLLVGALVLGASLAVPATNAQAAAPTAPFTALTMDGAGASTLMPAGESLAISGFDVQFNNFTGAAFEFSGGNNSNLFTTLVITPETSGDLAAGVTYQTRHTPDATHLGLQVSAESACGADESGTMSVEQFTRNADQTVATFAATYTASCDGTDFVTGELRLNSSVDYVAATPSYTELSYGPTDLGSSWGGVPSITLTSDGSTPLTLGTATVGGDHPEEVAITADTCSGKVLVNGATCSISAIGTPDTVGTTTATVVIPDNTKAGHRIIPVRIDGVFGSAGTYKPITPARLLDTRSGLGAPKAAVKAGGVVTLKVMGQGGVPAIGVSAVVLNVTETAATSSGYVTVYPNKVARPTASNLNFTAGGTQANSVTVQLGVDGYVDLYNSSTSTQLIADVTGYFLINDVLTPGGQLQPTQPERILDTRVGGAGPLPSGFAVTVPVDYGTAVNSHIRALVVNVTAVNPRGAGYLTAWNGTGNPPGTSTLNFPQGATTPNMAIVPTAICPASTCGAALPAIAIYNGGAASTDVLVDVVGLFDDSTLPDGLRFHAITPTRIVDTRTGLGAPSALHAGTIDAITSPAAITDDLTAALALNVTAVAPTSSTYLTLWPSDQTQPNVSTLNPSAGQTVANAAISTLSTDGNNRFSVYNHAGTTNVLIDVAGTYELYPYSPVATARPALASAPGTRPVLGLARATVATAYHRIG